MREHKIFMASKGTGRSIMKEINELDIQIEFWERISAEYPDSDAYKQNLVKTKDARDLLAAKIGAKNGN